MVRELTPFFDPTRGQRKFPTRVSASGTFERLTGVKTMTSYTIVDRDAVVEHLSGLSEAFEEYDADDELAAECDEILSRVLNEFHGIGQPINLAHSQETDYLELQISLSELVE